MHFRLSKKTLGRCRINGKESGSKKMEMMRNYLGDLSINITIDMAKGITSIVKNNLSEDQFLAAQQALHSKL